MARAVMTAEMQYERTLPHCPHCGADMDAATVALVDIVENAVLRRDGRYSLRIDAFVRVDEGGYTDTSKAGVVAMCPTCHRPAVLAMDGLIVKLVAARTSLDRKYMGEMADITEMRGLYRPPQPEPGEVITMPTVSGGTRTQSERAPAHPSPARILAVALATLAAAALAAAVFMMR